MKRITKIAYKLRGSRPVHFLHIGKTGGSAIKYAVSSHINQNRYQYFIRSSNVIYLHPHDVKFKDVPSGECVVFFLRDPVSRFVSAFYSRQRQGRPLGNYPWGPGEEKAFGYFNTPNELASALSSASEDKKAQAEYAMANIGHVRTSYRDWLESEEYLKSRKSDVLFVGFQEHLAEDFEILKSKLKLPCSLTLPLDEIFAHRNPTHLDRNLEGEAVANLEHWYSDDFQLMLFCKKLFREKIE